jgi:hypothetical protein
MKPHISWSIAAVDGCDYVREDCGRIVKRTEAGWKAYIARIAKQKSKMDGMTWVGVLCWVERRDAWRISYASQEYNVMRG